MNLKFAVLFALLCVGSRAQDDQTTVQETASNFNAQQQRFICNCPTEFDHVCGADGMTYGNQCILDCANIPLQHKGICDNKGCYPWGEEKCSDGNWDDHTPTCTIGLTFDGPMEAKCSGTGQGAQCTFKGVCKYRNDGKPDFIPTTGGKNIDIKAVASNTNPPQKGTPPYDYSEALAKLLLFYDSMISGNLTKACRRRLAWRSDSCGSCKGKYGEDLSGGFYEAGGSTLKYPATVSGFSGTMLAWAGIEFPNGFLRSGTMDDLKWKVKWAADHVINAHPQQYVFAGFLGNQTWDFDYFGPVEYYDNYNPPRLVGYVTKNDPGAEILADGAATLASALVLLANDTTLVDDAWRKNALNHAIQLYEWAKSDPRSYAESKDKAIKILNEMYSANNAPWDDLSWAATWLYRATGDKKYLTDASNYLKKSLPLDETPTFETGYKVPGAAILLANANNDATAVDTAKKYFNDYIDLKIGHTKGGLAYPYHWGASRHAGNLGFLTWVFAKNSALDAPYKARLQNYGMHQTNYLLGDAGRSWVVGFGKDWPQYIHHKFSYNSILTWGAPNKNPLDAKMKITDVDGPWNGERKDFVQTKAKFDFEGSRLPQSHTAYGLVFGAPLRDDGLVQTRRDYTYAEPTVEYNAGVVGAVAALADFYQTGQYTGVEKLDGVIPFSCKPPPNIPREVDAFAPNAFAPNAFAPVAAEMPIPMPLAFTPQQDPLLNSTGPDSKSVGGGSGSETEAAPAPASSSSSSVSSTLMVVVGMVVGVVMLQ